MTAPIPTGRRRGRRRTNASLTTADLVVLATLCERPMHGYDLASELERRDVRDWAAVSRPQVYYSLNKLHGTGHIRLSRDTEDSLGPERLTYAISAKGRDALHGRLRDDSWVRDRQAPLFVTWFALSWLLAEPEREAVMQARQRFLNDELQRERETLVSLQKERPVPEYARAMVKYAIAWFEMELRWLDDLLPRRRSP